MLIILSFPKILIHLDYYLSVLKNKLREIWTWKRDVVLMREIAGDLSNSWAEVLRPSISLSFNGKVRNEACQFEKAMFSIKVVVVMKTMKTVLSLNSSFSKYDFSRCLRYQDK